MKKARGLARQKRGNSPTAFMITQAGRGNRALACLAGLGEAGRLGRACSIAAGHPPFASLPEKES